MLNIATMQRKQSKSLLKLALENFGKQVNSVSADYSPVSMAIDTVLYFISNRKGNTVNCRWIW